VKSLMLLILGNAINAKQKQQNFSLTCLILKLDNAEQKHLALLHRTTI